MAPLAAVVFVVMSIAMAQVLAPEPASTVGCALGGIEGGSWAAGLGAVPGGSQLCAVLQSVCTAVGSVTDRSAAALAAGSARVAAAHDIKNEAPPNIENEAAPPNIQNEETRKKYGAIAFVAVAGVTVATIAMAPVVLPPILGAAGFGAKGIAAKSLAASMMSSYGGTVTGGSLCATLQSVGTAGLSTAAIAATEGTAAALAAGSAAIGSWLFKEPATSNNNGNEATPN